MEIYYSPGSDHLIVMALAGVVLLAALIGVLASVKPGVVIHYEWVKDSEDSDVQKFRQSFTRSYKRLWVSLVLFGVAVVAAVGVSAYFYQLELGNRAEVATEAGLESGKFQTLLDQADTSGQSDVVQNDEDMFVQVKVSNRSQLLGVVQQMKITVTEDNPTEGTEKE